LKETPLGKWFQCICNAFEKDHSLEPAAKLFILLNHEEAVFECLRLGDRATKYPFVHMDWLPFFMLRLKNKRSQGAIESDKYVSVKCRFGGRSRLDCEGKIMRVLNPESNEFKKHKCTRVEGLAFELIEVFPPGLPWFYFTFDCNHLKQLI
jgi:hypothetical protein